MRHSDKTFSSQKEIRRYEASQSITACEIAGCVGHASVRSDTVEPVCARVSRVCPASPRCLFTVVADPL